MQASAAALWINTVFAGFDQSITTAVHNLYLWAGDFFTPFFEFISFLGHDGIILVLLSIALMLFKKTRRFGTAMLFGVAIGAIFTNCILKVLIARPRPYADDNSIFYQFWLLVEQNVESDKSFHSGHTTAAFATMTAVFMVGDKRVSWTAYIFAILMGLARIYLVVHFPSDVLAGIIVGIIAGVLGTILSRKLPEKFYDKNIFQKKGGGAHCSAG